VSFIESEKCFTLFPACGTVLQIIQNNLQNCSANWQMKDARFCQENKFLQRLDMDRHKCLTDFTGRCAEITLCSETG